MRPALAVSSGGHDDKTGTEPLVITDRAQSRDHQVPCPLAVRSPAGRFMCYIAGRYHVCVEAVAQVAMLSGVSFALDVIFRHSPEAWLTRVFPVPGVHTWVVAVPLQVFSTTCVPLTIASPAVSRHRPWISMLPLDSTEEVWLVPPTQVDISVGVPLFLLLPTSTMQTG